MCGGHENQTDLWILPQYFADVTKLPIACWRYSTLNLQLFVLCLRRSFHSTVYSIIPISYRPATVTYILRKSCRLLSSILDSCWPCKLRRGRRQPVRTEIAGRVVTFFFWNGRHVNNKTANCSCLGLKTITCFDRWIFA